MRMSVRLTEIGLTRRLTWQEVADIRADHEADVAAVVEQALADHERFSPDAARARHVAIVYQLLETAATYRSGAYYEPRNFATTAKLEATPDFRRPGDVIDVDPADVPDLPGLADVPGLPHQAGFPQRLAS